MKIWPASIVPTMVTWGFTISNHVWLTQPSSHYRFADGSPWRRFFQGIQQLSTLWALGNVTWMYGQLDGANQACSQQIWYSQHHKSTEGSSMVILRMVVFGHHWPEMPGAGLEFSRNGIPALQISHSSFFQVYKKKCGGLTILRPDLE